MIGWYVHHQGRGHLHRAVTVAAELTARTGVVVTGLSSMPRPAGWAGPWVQLPPDDAGDAPRHATAGGTLHWAPVGDPHVRDRATTLSAWLGASAPDLVVVDVSVEVATLVRLHGVPVVSVVLPGDRTDDAHLLGLRLSTEVVACWPPSATTTGPGMLPGLPADVAGRVRAVGAVSRIPVDDDSRTAAGPGSGRPRRPGRPRVVVLQGRGGGALTGRTGDALAALAPGWDWTEVGGGRWVEDPTAALRDADVVVTNAGQNSLAEIAACRVPAVVVPADRPHDEQATTARVLDASAWPALVVRALPEDDWSGLLERARLLDGSAWETWCDGGAAARFADVVTSVLEPYRPEGRRTA